MPEISFLSIIKNSNDLNGNYYKSDLGRIMSAKERFSPRPEWPEAQPSPMTACGWGGVRLVQERLCQLPFYPFPLSVIRGTLQYSAHQKFVSLPSPVRFYPRYHVLASKSDLN